jgi:cobyrinic acid a,c-diamide synthase
MPVLGGLLRDDAITIPERHLGLVTTEDDQGGTSRQEQLAAVIENRLDLDALLAGLPDVDPPPIHPPLRSPQPADVRIGVARDAAFCFYYPDNLELLEAAGATLVFFSPLADNRLPEGVGGLYFGGGYPELHAGALADNPMLRNQIRRASRDGMPIYGECGGFMYLCREMGDTHGRVAPMTGCLPMATRMLDRLKSLGYREVTQVRETILGPAGQVMRGHEFHYSEIVCGWDDVSRAYGLTDRVGIDRRQAGFTVHRTLGSYVHLHFGGTGAAIDHIYNQLSGKDRDIHGHD